MVADLRRETALTRDSRPQSEAQGAFSFAGRESLPFWARYKPFERTPYPSFDEWKLAQLDSAPRADPMGDVPLSKAHNGTSNSSILVKQGGSRVEVVAPALDPRANKAPGKGGGTRGKISSFSPQSARNFKAHLEGLQRTAFLDAGLLTLTYPKEFPADPEVYNMHLHRFKQECVRYFKRTHGVDVSGYWKKEFQKRLAAHFHILLFGVGKFRDMEQLYPVPDSETPEDRRRRLRCFGSVEMDLRRIWVRIVGSGDSKHMLKGLEMEALASIQGGINYIANYSTKKDQTLEGVFVGRYWGKINGHALPEAPELKVEIPDTVAFDLRRIIFRKVKQSTEVGRWHHVLREARKRLLRDGLSRLELESLFKIKVPYTPDHVAWVIDGGDRPGGIPRNVTREDLVHAWRLSGHFGEPPLRPPRRYKNRNNRRVVLSCDADAVLAALLRGWRDPEQEPF